MRIAIIGNGGSGKTYLANRLSKELNIPVTHLDDLYYDAQWNVRSDFADVQREIVEQREWIIEGNYASTMHIRLTMADVVFWLNPHPATCFLRIAQRWIRGERGRITVPFLRYVWTYRRDMEPRIRAMIAGRGINHRVTVLHSRREITRMTSP